MRLKKSMSMLIAISMLVSNVPIVMAKEEAVKIPSRSIYTHKEIIGKDRYETGRKVLEESKRYKNIIVVNGSEEKLVDGLCASGLVEKLNATILPINPKKVDKKSMEYINKAENVYIIGEKQAIPYSFEKSINKKVKVVRIGGKDRYETSEKIAKYIGSYDKAYLVNGAIGHPDAMSISSVAAKEKSPIILTKKDSSKADKKKGVEYTAIGGTSVISNSLVSKYSAKRIGGETRYETNRMVLNEYYPNSSIRYFTNGETLVDALSAASISKNDGITFINRHKNHDLLEDIDTVQVGGFPYKITFENKGTGTGGSGGTVVPPSKPNPPEEKPNNNPSKPEAEAIVEKENFDKVEKKYPVKIKITKASIDEDGDKITYQYKYKDDKGNDVIKNLEEKDGYYPIGNYKAGNYKVEVRAIDDRGGESQWCGPVEFAPNLPPLTPSKEDIEVVVYKRDIKNSKIKTNIILDTVDPDDDEFFYEFKYDGVIKQNEYGVYVDYFPIGKSKVQFRVIDKRGAASEWCDVDFEIKDKAKLADGESVNWSIEHFKGIKNIKKIKFIKEKNVEYPKGAVSLEEDDSEPLIKAYVPKDDKETLIISSVFTIYANKDCKNMFSGLSELEKIEFDNFDTSEVWNMENMFLGCEKLDNLDLSSFKTDNLSDVKGMFRRCLNLKNINLENFNTSNVRSMISMFHECEKLEKIDLSSFNTSKVTTMFSMFYSCKSLNNIIGLKDFDTSKLSNIDYMFNRCEGLSGEMTLRSNSINYYGHAFDSCSVMNGAKLTIYYTKEAENAVNKMKKDIDYDENVKFVLIQSK